MNEDAFIQMRQVGKSFRRGDEVIQVLKSLDLAVEQSDFVAIMGPSGSGKTTLLNLLGGLDQADYGAIVVGGQLLTSLSAGALATWRAAHVGFVFQSYNLLEGLSAARNVELPLLLTRLSRSERAGRVRAVLDAVGLAERHRHKPAQLSGGQQQRVAIARALIADPDVLLCDEPTGDLDRDTADQILGLLSELNCLRGKTILMVTHDPLAAAHARRIIRVDKGVIMAAPALGEPTTDEQPGLPAAIL